MWFRLIIIGGVIAVAAGVGAWWLQSRVTGANTLPATPVVSDTSQQAPRVQAVIVDASDEEARVLLCEQEKCRELKRPDARNNEAVFDGTSWYFYTGEREENEEEDQPDRTSGKIALQKVSLSGTKELLMESTPLTAPRGLFIDPDGNALAFFLDNISQPQEQLTEVWVYDATEGGTRVLAEKLYAPDIRSRPRWNRAGTLLWFIADTGPQSAKEDTLELLTVSGRPAQLTTAFTTLDWERLHDTAENDLMDISSDGQQLAYASRSLLGRALLNVVRIDGERRQVITPGSMVHLEWLADGAILYVTQDERGFTVWHDQNGLRRHVARRPGVFLSGHTDSSQEIFVMVTANQENERAATLFGLNLTSGVLVEAGTLSREHDQLHVVQVAQQIAEQDALSQVTRELGDDELAAFIDQHLGEIVGGNVQPVRLIVTDKVNTAFVDYSLENREERLLLTVHDAALKEWTIRARYTQQGGEWQKTQGASTADPRPLRLYEWEESLTRWILKSDFSLDS